MIVRANRTQRHQVQAILFILRREPGNRFTQASNAVVTTAVGVPQTNNGGLIGDVMGMGKSLTILTTILCTLENARTFPQFFFQSPNVVELDRRTSTQATLIVVPSAREFLLPKWFELVLTARRAYA